MATNEVFKPGTQLSVVCTNPTTPASGGPVRYGMATGIALITEASDGLTTVDFGSGVWDLSVKGIDDSGNSAVAVGDAIFYVDADTPKLSKKSSGYFFGIAMEVVSSAATTTINVMHVQSPGSGTLGTGTVGTSNLASGAVTAAKIGSGEVTAVKLSATLKTGYIGLPITTAREIVTNAIPNAAAIGGLLASDTTPILARVNGATDKKLRLDWAASNSDAITFDVAYPADLDDTAILTVCILAAMNGVTDTPTVAINFFEGVGDTNAGGNTAAVTGTTVAKYSRAIAAADVGVAPNAASIEIVPGTHTTDKLYVYGAWIEYTRA